MEELQVVKAEIIRLLKQVNNHDWQTFHLTIEAPPFSNKGFNSVPVFLDKNGNKIQASWKADGEYAQRVLALIFQINQKEKRNQILFFTKRDAYAGASIFVSFSQNIEDAFQSRLPAPERGKIIPWFKAKS